MGKIAFLYPGQGAQKIGMGKDFYENSEKVRTFFAEASAKTGLDLAALCFEENDQLNLTEYTQAAMVTTCLAMTDVIMENGLKPDVTAGLSLGEYAAIAAANAMSKVDAVRLVRKRGILMQNTVPQGQGAMYAVMAMDAKKIEEILADIDGVSIANYNCPGQIVITGKTEATEIAAKRLKEAGAKRVMKLNVSGPFHSKMLEPAGKELEAELENITISSLQIPYVTNVTAELIENEKDIKSLLVKQVSSPVRWMQSMEKLVEEGVDTFVEIGPGKTLSGFMKKICPEVTVYNISTWEDLLCVKEKLQL